MASCVLNRTSTPTTTTWNEKSSKGYYLHSCINSTNSGNTRTDFESENPITQNNVDLSWLPNYDDNNNSASESHHQNRETDFDYSWLPDHVNTNRNGSTTASTSSRSVESENDSWLPSTPIVNSGIDDSWLPNYNDVKKNTSTKPNYLIRETETDSHHSRFPTSQIVTNGNHTKHKKSKNHTHEVVSSDDLRIQHNKNPESLKSQGQVSPSNSNRCSVETDSLGGVTTLLRRFQNLTETSNTNGKPKSSSCSNHNKPLLVLTDGNDNNSPVSPSIFFDASDGGTSPTTTADSCVNVEKDKIQLAASQAAGKTNKKFARICKTWDRNDQVAGGKTRLIRGRQAFKDFLNQMEQDKKRELESLAKRKHVSQFSYRDRIQALLRDRFITNSNHTTEVPNKADYDEELDDDFQFENFHDCSSEYSQSQSDWEEEDEEWGMQPYDDWISDITRPRSYWECMRQARYQEMLHLDSYKHDIQELLERRCVSSFLSSDLRVMIEQLMVSQTQEYSYKGIEVRKEGMEGGKRLKRWK